MFGIDNQCIYRCDPEKWPPLVLRRSLALSLNFELFSQLSFQPLEERKANVCVYMDDTPTVRSGCQ